MEARQARRPRRTEIIGLRTPPGLKDAVERAAASDERSISGFVLKVLTDHCRQLGYLPAVQPPARGQCEAAEPAS